MTKKLFCVLLAALLSLCAFVSCETSEGDSQGSNGENTSGIGEQAQLPLISELDITFSGNKISASQSSSAIEINENVLTIKSGGKYTLTGELDGGRIIVNAPKTEKVELILFGINISCSDNAPIYVKSCDKVKIILEKGTINTLTDGVKYDLPSGEDKPNACLYSSEDIDIEGEGTLIVNANYNNGIASKNDIDIESGRIEISAKNNAIKGRDSVSILGGEVIITASDDGIKSDNDEDTSKGYVSIEGGKIEINATDDAIQACSSVSLTGGTVITAAEGKAINCDGNITLSEGVLTEN